MKSATQEPRILCLWFPDWPLQRVLAARPEWSRSLLVLMEPTRRGEFVRHCSRPAWKRGIRPGMPVSEARTFVQGRERLVIQPVQPAEDRRALVELALRCEPFSFRIALEEAERPESLFLDVTGVAPLFQGEATLARELWEAVSLPGGETRLAIADTAGAAWAAAHFLSAPDRPVIVPGGESAPIVSLPVEGLRLKEAVRSRLRRLGLRTIRQLLDLDRAALLRRLGHELLSRLDQFTGRQPEPLTPCHPPPRYRVEWNSDDSLLDREMLRRIGFQLLEELLKPLQARHLGLRRLEFRFRLETGRQERLRLPLCEATSNPRHLEDLLQLRLEQLRLSAPVIALELEAFEVVPLKSNQQEFFETEPRNLSPQLSRLLNRLSNRLGEDAVVVPHLMPDPVPEQAVQFRSVTDAAAPMPDPPPLRLHCLDRPTALFPSPRPIDVVAILPEGLPQALFWSGERFDIAHCWGPERIESGWWRIEPVCRDYYRVETVTGQRLWIFRQLKDQCWFWHGELV